MPRLVFISLVLLSCLAIGQTYDDVKEVSPQDLTQYVLDHRLTAVFAYRGVCEKQCLDQRQAVADGWLQSTDFLDDIVLVQSDISATRTGPWYDDQQPLPTLLFYRDASPIVFEGEWTADVISMWFSDNQEPIVQELTDETFEHDTQAATGATTGDWLVLFYSNDYKACPLCMSRRTSLLTVASRLRSRFVFGAVNVDSSPKLKERFGIDSPPALYLFRKGQMYLFEVDSQTANAVSTQMAAFLTGGYENRPALTVTLSRVKESQSTWISDLLPVFGVLAIIVVLFLIAGACLERVAKRQHQKKKSSKGKSSDGSSSPKSGGSARRRV